MFLSFTENYDAVYVFSEFLSFNGFFLNSLTALLTFPDITQ